MEAQDFKRGETGALGFNERLAEREREIESTREGEGGRERGRERGIEGEGGRERGKGSKSKRMWPKKL